MNKFIAFICLIVTLYIIAIFVIPDTADNIGKTIGIEKFNTTIRGAKSAVDSTVELTGGILDVGQKTEQIRGAYDKAVEQGKEIKNKIDTVRVALSGAEDTANKAIETANTVIKTGQEIQQQVNQVRDTINSVNKLGNSLQGTGATQ